MTLSIAKSAARTYGPASTEIAETPVCIVFGEQGPPREAPKTPQETPRRNAETSMGIAFGALDSRLAPPRILIQNARSKNSFPRATHETLRTPMFRHLGPPQEAPGGPRQASGGPRRPKMSSRRPQEPQNGPQEAPGAPKPGVHFAFIRATDQKINR